MEKNAKAEKSSEKMSSQTSDKAGKKAPLRSSRLINKEMAEGEANVSRRAIAREGKIIRDGKEVSAKEVLYNGGPVRVVTEADIAADPRLVAASVVAGQLYDFSNLPHIPDGSAEANVEGFNEAHAEADEEAMDKADRAKVTPAFTSEEDRARLGISSTEEVSAKDKRDNETRKRLEDRRATQKARVVTAPQGQGRSARDAVQKGK